MHAGMQATVGVEHLLVGVLLGALAGGCASVEYRVPASEMVRLVQMPPDARGEQIRVVPASTPIGPPLTAAMVAPPRPSATPQAEPDPPEGSEEEAAAEATTAVDGDAPPEAADPPVDVPDVAIDWAAASGQPTTLTFDPVTTTRVRITMTSPSPGTSAGFLAIAELQAVTG